MHRNDWYSCGQRRFFVKCFFGGRGEFGSRSGFCQELQEEAEEAQYISAFSDRSCQFLWNVPPGEEFRCSGRKTTDS